jgi:hypothetical protein
VVAAEQSGAFQIVKKIGRFGNTQIRVMEENTALLADF